MSRLRVVQDQVTGEYSLIGNNKEVIKNSNEYLKIIEVRGLSRCTMRAYAYDLLFIFRWLEKEKKEFKALTQKDLVDFTQYQQKEKSMPRSINRRLTTCEVFYRFCFDKDLPHIKGVSYPNPHYKGPPKDRNFGLFHYKKTNRLKFRVKVPKTLIVPLEIKEINQFLKNVNRYRDISIVALMLLCGLRASETISIRIDDIDLIERRIRIRGKGNKERVLPLPDQIIEMLQKYLTLERPAKCKTDIAFVVLQGKRRCHPMRYSGLRSLFRYKRNKSTVLNANPHRFRHVFGASMARSGVHLPILQKMMGHSDGKSTLQYINLSVEDIAEEYQRAMKKIGKRYEIL